MQKCALAGTASPYRCTRRCTRFSALRADPLTHEQQQGAHIGPCPPLLTPLSVARTPPQTPLHLARDTRARNAFSLELNSTSPPQTCKRSNLSSSSKRRRERRLIVAAVGTGARASRATAAGSWAARNRGWWCTVWCRWTDVKHIFHWNGENGEFDMVKFNTMERDQYETHADIRLLAGMVLPRSLVFLMFFGLDIRVSRFGVILIVRLC